MAQVSLSLLQVGGQATQLSLVSASPHLVSSGSGQIMQIQSGISLAQQQGQIANPQQTTMFRQFHLRAPQSGSGDGGQK